MRVLLATISTVLFFTLTTQANELEAVPAVAAAVETPQSPAVEKESDIPLNLEAPKKASEDGSPFFKMLLAFSMMGVVGFGAYFFVRKYSKNNFAINKHNQIKVLTQHFLGPKKSLAIIRVAGESILIGVTEQNINMIKSLSLLDDEVPDMTPAEFSGLVEEEDKTENRTGIEDEDDEFSIRGIKEVVSKRLKGMRSL